MFKLICIIVKITTIVNIFNFLCLLYCMPRKKAFENEDMKTLKFDVPTWVYWEARRYWGVLKVDTWSKFMVKVIMILKELEKEGRLESAGAGLTQTTRTNHDIQT